MSNASKTLCQYYAENDASHDAYGDEAAMSLAADSVVYGASTEAIAADVPVAAGWAFSVRELVSAKAIRGEV